MFSLPKLMIVIGSDVDKAKAGIRGVKEDLEGVGDSADRANRRSSQLGNQLGKTGRVMGGQFRSAVQNTSFQLADMAVMMEMGIDTQRVMAQQLPQLLGGFGALGAVLGTVVAIGIPMSVMFGANAEAAEAMTNALGVLAPALQSLGPAFQAAKDFAVDFAEIVYNNLDRVLIIAGTFATFFAGRWVAAFIAARVSTFTLVGALTALRAAIIRTGIGALIVLIGEGIYQFMRLTEAVGGVGVAFGLLGDVAKEVWERVVKGARAAELGVLSAWEGIRASFLSMLADMQEKWFAFVRTMATVVKTMPVPGANALGDSMLGSLEGGVDTSGIRSDAESADIASQAYGSQAGQLLHSMTGPLESVQKIKDVLKSIKDERLTLPDLFGTGTEDDEEGGGGSKGKDPVVESLEAKERALESLRQTGRDTYSALAGFLQQFAGKSKAAAIAVIAIQKGLSIAQIISNTAAAQMRALAELGPIAGPPVAAKIGAYGKIQAALVAATGLAQAASAGGGGASSLGSSGGGGSSSSSAEASSTTRTVSEVRIFGNVGLGGQELVDVINAEYERGNYVKVSVQ